jgi:hypothetical protein
MKKFVVLASLLIGGSAMAYNDNIPKPVAHTKALAAKEAAKKASKVAKEEQKQQEISVGKVATPKDSKIEAQSTETSTHRK